MRKIIFFCFILFSALGNSQTDYSEKWEDFFSYNNVKDFVVAKDKIYALCDNAVFTYHLETNKIEKMSSVNGLSGETTSAIYYNEKYDRLVIGYETGLVEVVGKDKKITISPDIVNFNQLGLKQINSIYEHNNKLYISTPFAIIGYDIEKLEFGDTYFIGVGSSAEDIKSVTVLNDKIYAASPNGIYKANIGSTALIDAGQWNLKYPGNYKKIVTFNNRIYAVSGKNLGELTPSGVANVQTFPEDITDIKVMGNNLTVSLNRKAISFNSSMLKVSENIVDEPINTSFVIDNKIFLATKKRGILTGDSGGQNYRAVHPKGPVSNKVFGIDAHNNSLWVTYGGRGESFYPLNVRKGYSHFNGKTWVNKMTIQKDLTSVTINKKLDNKVFISSVGSTSDKNSLYTGGLLEIENDQLFNFYNHKNSSLEYINSEYPQTTTIRIGATIFDSQGDLWITNIGVNNRLHKMSASGQWNSYNLNELYLNNRFGMSDITIDKSNTLWISTRGNGVFIFNEKGEKKKALTTDANKGNLPNNEVASVAVDKRDRVWVGTINGLVVYNNALNIFKAGIYKAEPIIILDDGTPKKLLGDQRINSISIDGADNKWFGTDNSGVLCTNPTGEKTLNLFNKDNSPLPSNKILKIKVDVVTGKVYFATSKGIVAYNSDISPFGTSLGEVYAYPNPVLKEHDFVTIDGRKGEHLPKGTNVKILDISGNLVYETNVVEDQQINGGKVIWDKRNLAGNKVASGIYIVLLTTEDNSENTTTKIAIVN